MVESSLLLQLRGLSRLTCLELLFVECVVSPCLEAHRIQVEEHLRQNLPQARMDIKFHPPTGYHSE